MAHATHPELRPARGGAIFLAALGAAWRRPAAWGLYALALVLLALPAALSTQRTQADLIGQRYGAGETVHHLDVAFRVDHADALAHQADLLATLGGPLGLIALLLGVFAAGGWLGVLLDGPERSQGRRFLTGGGRYFWRFLGLALTVLVLLAAWHWVLFAWPYEQLLLVRGFGLERPDVQLFDSEATALWLGWGQAGMHALGLGLVLSWALYTRARCAVQQSNSVVLAGFAAFWMLLRHPVRTLRPLLLLFVVELALVSGALGAVSRAIDGSLLGHPDGWRVVLLVAISLVALLVSAVVFGARYAAAVTVVRSLVKPLPLTDPWQDRIGPPGGPQYPLGGQDEFTVSM